MYKIPFVPPKNNVSTYPQTFKEETDNSIFANY